MFIGNFAVTRFEVIVLRLIVLLRIIAILVRCKNLILGQQEQIIRGRGHVAGGIAAARIIRILRAGLHRRPQVRGKCSQQRVGGRTGGRTCATQHLAPHLTASPATRVRVAGVHRERTRRRSRAAVAAIHQTNKLAADLTQQEVDTVAALLAGIVVETDDKGINFQAGDCSCTHLAIDGYTLSVAHRPPVLRLALIGHLADNFPLVLLQNGVDVGQRQSIILVLGGGNRGVGRVGAQRCSDAPCTQLRRIENDSAVSVVAAHNGREGGISAGGRDLAAHRCGQRQNAKMYSGRVATTVLRHLDFCGVTDGIAPDRLNSIGTRPLDTHRCHAVAVGRRLIGFARTSHGSGDGRAGGRRYRQRGSEVRQIERILTAHDIDSDGVVRGQTGQ